MVGPEKFHVGFQPAAMSGQQDAELCDTVVTNKLKLVDNKEEFTGRVLEHFKQWKEGDE